MVYEHTYLNSLLLLHFVFKLRALKKYKDAAKTAEVGGHGMHWIVTEITLLIMEKSWKNPGIVFLNFCGNPDIAIKG